MNHLNKTNIITVILTFTGLAILSVFLFSQINGLHEELLISRLRKSQLYFSAIIAFNCIGMLFLYISNRLKKIENLAFDNKKLLLMQIIAIAVIMFLMNYLFVKISTLMIGIDEPFYWRPLIAISIIEIIILSLIFVVNMYRNTFILYKNNIELRDNLMLNKYMALQNQLNPHFLFNSLNTLISEISYDPKNAMEFTRCLSEVYRYVLQVQEHKVVSLNQELDFLKSYIFLFKVRLGDCFELLVDLDKEAEECYIPPLTIQLLFENIFKHNTIDIDTPMSIRIYTEENDSILCVSNSYNPKSKKRKSSGVGLKNLDERCRLIMDKSIITTIENDLYIVKVPFLQ